MSAEVLPGLALREWDDGGVPRAVLSWDAAATAVPAWRMLSTGVLGGGLGRRGWWLDAGVAKEYHHGDPAGHVASIAAGLGLAGAGVGMLTAADVRRWTAHHDRGVAAVATVGLGLPVWAAADDAAVAAETAPAVGTINVLLVVPAPLLDAAAANLLVTATEAKTQALLEAGVRGTGTSSDALCVAWPEPGPGAEPEPYGGPRSTWGLRAARAVHGAVAAGTADWLERQLTKITG